MNIPERKYFVAAGRGQHVAIDTTALTDNRLSWKAKALHYFIRTQMEALSNQQELVDAGPDGRDAVGSGIRELIQHKYLFAKQQRNENGEFICMVYVSFPEPVHITEEQVSTLLGTGSVHMAGTQNAPMSTPHTENPFTVGGIYYLTTLSITINNKSLRDLSYNSSAAQRRPSNFENLPQEVTEIFDLWNSQPALPTHKKNPKYKKYRNCIKAIKGALRKYDRAQIGDSIQEYNNLLASPYTALLKKTQPMRVGLDEFFSFSSYSQQLIVDLKPGSPMHEIVSWFDECKQGPDYLMTTYGRLRKDHHPDVTRILEAELESATSWRPVSDSVWDKNAFRQAADMLVEFHKHHRGSLPFSYSAGDLARDFVNMVSTFNNPHPGMLINTNTWEAFDRYLNNLAIMQQHTGGDRGFTATASI